MVFIGDKNDSPDRKGKPFERMGRKALDLRVINKTYGSGVTEVGMVIHLAPF